MVFPGPSRSQTERFAGDVWAAVASGLGGRLFEALRDRRSLAYTVMGSTWQKGRGGALVTYIATSPEREAEAREAMLDELERFAVEGITPDELARAVNYLAGQVEVNRQSGIQLLSDIAEAWLIGEGLRDLRDPGAQGGRHRAGQESRLRESRSPAADFSAGSLRRPGPGRCPSP
jgi:predicted Zn-dependent peptidase